MKKDKLKNVKILIMILILILIIIIYFIYYYFNNNDKFERIFPPFDLPDSIFKTIVNTPLVPLSSPLKQFEKGKKLPDIYIYDPQFLAPVRNQFNCGACWAFVITSMISDCITVRITDFGKNLSVQELLTCYPLTSGCEGAEPESVLLWLERSGFKIAISDDYTPVDTGECKRFADVGIPLKKKSVKSLCTFIDKESSKDLINNKTLIENIYNMKMEIRNNGPIYSTISVYEDFFDFLGNKIYFKTNDNFIGGHAVEIIGWCDKGIDKRNGFKEYGYWICKNSWGKKWSNKYDFPGYFAIRMGYNECGIESRTGCAEPAVDFKLPNDEISSKIVLDSFDKLLYKIVNKVYIQKYLLLD